MTLREYVYGDPRWRRAGDRISLIIAFVWFGASMIFQLSATTALIQSIVVLIAAQVATTWWYCRPQTAEISDSVVAIRRMRLAEAISLAATAVSILFLARPRIEAAVIADRLRRIAQDPTPQSLKTASSLVEIANTDRIIIPRRPIEQIVTHRWTEDEVVQAVKEPLVREAESRGLPTPVVGMIIQNHDDVGTLTLRGITGEGVDPRQWPLLAGQVQPPPPPVPPDMVGFFAPIGSRAASPSKPGVGFFRVNGFPGQVVIELDGAHVKNVMFMNCALKYSGRAIELENVGFFNPKFEFSENIKCQRLAEVILASPSATLSLD
jgi:hypothetical protein